MEKSVYTSASDLKLAMCNFIKNIDRLKQFAIENEFAGIDWSFNLAELPHTPAEESRWVKKIADLQPLEVRFHCPFDEVDLGHENPDRVGEAMELFRRIIRLVSKADGKYLTLHIGLGRDTTRVLSWEKTIGNLRRIVQYGADRTITVCLENLAWGWTSKPNLFEKLIRRTGAGVTFDIGHAHCCEAVRSQQFGEEDFVTPHAERVYNAHLYHTEISGVGHLPVKHLKDVRARLDALIEIGCRWWVIEIREFEGLLQTKRVVDRYLIRQAGR
jgi:sugar phosphate isomerase/epimerase